MQANGIEIWYEDAGAADAPVILLVMGLATQLIAWPEGFVTGLVDAGYRVIRYDNRDVGKSSRMDGAAAPHPLWVLAASRMRVNVALAYDLQDMAADAVGLLDVLGIDTAHVVGASMGGMIAQRIAAGWPERTASLTVVMSSSGARGLPGPTPALLRQILKWRPLNASREAAVALGVETLALISHPDPLRAPDAFAHEAACAFDRGYNPVGARRQLNAIVADTGRADILPAITARTLVIHGRADPLVPLPNGEDVARRIPGARMVTIDAMAHDLPPSELPALIALVADHAFAGTSDTGIPASARAVR